MSDIDPFENIPKEDTHSTGASLFSLSNALLALSRWWLMLIFGVLGCVLALYYLSIAPAVKHKATTILEVDIKERQLMGVELERERLTPEIALATEASKLMGRAVLTEAAESPEVQALEKAIPPPFSWTPKYWRSAEKLAFKPASSKPLDKLVNYMEKSWVAVNTRRNTSLIEVQVSHPDSESARVIADTLLNSYLEREQRAKRGGASEAFKVLKAEADEARQSLEKAERSLQVYVSALKLSKGIAESHPKMIAMRQRYKSQHPNMIESEVVYLDMYNRFRREIERATESALERDYWLEFAPKMEALHEKSLAGGNKTTKAREEWLALVQNALGSRASRLNALIKHQQQRYQSITQRMTEIDVAEKNNTVGLRVVEEAFAADASAKPLHIYLAAGTSVGVIGGFCISFLLVVYNSFSYNLVSTIEESTGLTCMATIPSAEMFSRNPLTIDIDPWTPTVELEPRSSNAEAIQNLRTALILQETGDSHKSLLVTSAIPGEGKTTIATELAAAYSLKGERTLLIDFDLRKPRLHEYFPQVKGQLGIIDILRGKANLHESIFKTTRENLFVIGSGSNVANSAEFLDEYKLIELVEGLSSQFDRIIVDSAPILPVSDSRLLAKHLSKVIYVSRGQRTPISAIVRAKDLIRQSGGDLAGIVLNDLNKSSNKGFYGYQGYGKYGFDEYYSESSDS